VQIAYVAKLAIYGVKFLHRLQQKLICKQANKFIRQNNITTILIQDVNNAMARYQKEIIPSSWSPTINIVLNCLNSTLFCVFNYIKSTKTS